MELEQQVRVKPYCAEVSASASTSFLSDSTGCGHRLYVVQSVCNHLLDLYDQAGCFLLHIKANGVLITNLGRECREHGTLLGTDLLGGYPSRPLKETLDTVT